MKEQYHIYSESQTTGNILGFCIVLGSCLFLLFDASLNRILAAIGFLLLGISFFISSNTPVLHLLIYDSGISIRRKKNEWHGEWSELNYYKDDLASVILTLKGKEFRIPENQLPIIVIDKIRIEQARAVSKG